MIAEKRKIIAVHLLNDFSGSPLVFRQALEVLQRQGDEIHVYTSSGGKGFLSGIPDADYHFFRYRWSPNKYLTLFFYLFSQTGLFFRLLFSLNRDSVVYVNTVLPFGAMLAGFFRGCRVVVHVHETSVKPALLKKFLFGITDMTANDVIYVSEYLKKSRPLTKTNQHVIHNCLPDSFIRNITKMEHNAGSVLMICSLKAYKGIYEFADLARHFNKYLFELVVNASQKELDEFFRGFDVPQNLNIHPVTEDVHKYYRNAALVLNLSLPDQWVETFGMTVLEAMSYGIPVIVPPVGGVTELVEHNVNGFLCNSRNMKKLKTYVTLVMENTQVHKTLAEESAKKSAQFTGEKFSTGVRKLFADSPFRKQVVTETFPV